MKRVARILPLIRKCDGTGDFHAAIEKQKDKHMKKRYKFLIICLTFGILTGACTAEFEEINTNPNATENITNPGLLLPRIIRVGADNLWDCSWDRGAVFADQIGYQYASSFTNIFRSDAQGYYLWSYYSLYRDLSAAIKISEEMGYANYQGIYLVIKCWFFQCLTDLYGPIPYSEAGRATESINNPKFDSQEEIYAGILADLEMANSLLGSTNEVVNGDILYSGNIKKWKMFANALRLRVLLRQCDRVNPSAEMQKMVSDPVKYPLFASHADQAALQYLATRENAHPTYRGNVSDYASSCRLSYNMELRLKAINDPRLAVYAMPTSATINTNNPQYFGVPNGIGDAAVNAWNGGTANHSPLGLLWAPYSYSPVYASMTAAQSVIISYSEVQFILAEARERGFITEGSAETYYLNGIKSQFSYYASRIPAGYVRPTAAQVTPPAGYYTQAGVAYTGSATEKLTKIYTQKWFSLFLCGFEAWSEWRRVNVPTITPGPNSGGPVPTRVLYPADEMNINTEKYNEAVQLLGGDGDAITTRVWWDVN